MNAKQRDVVLTALLQTLSGAITKKVYSCAMNFAASVYVQGLFLYILKIKLKTSQVILIQDVVRVGYMIQQESTNAIISTNTSCVNGKTQKHIVDQSAETSLA